MATATDVKLYVQREALIRKLLEVDNLEVIQKMQRTLMQTLSAIARGQEKTAEGSEEIEYISPEEQSDRLLKAFTEFYRGKKQGVKRQTAEDLLNEL